MTRDEWTAVLAPGRKWQDAYPLVEREVRTYLNGLPEGSILSTAELVAKLHPWGGPAQARLFRSLAAMATHGLADCATRGTAKRNGFGREVCPWLWHASHPHDNLEAVIAPAGRRAEDAMLRAIRGLDEAARVLQPHLRQAYGEGIIRVTTELMKEGLVSTARMQEIASAVAASLNPSAGSRAADVAVPRAATPEGDGPDQGGSRPHGGAREGAE